MSLSLPPIIGMGAALVDIALPIDAHDLRALEDEIGSKKGTMQLIDAAQSRALLARLAKNNPSQKEAGGAAANTIAGLTRFSIPTRFLGKIGDDEFGAFFKTRLAADGTEFSVAPHKQLATGHCVVAISADGERTMHTHLGASGALSTEDIPREKTQASFLFAEAYIWDSATARAAFLTLAPLIRAQGGRVCLSLGDSALCARHQKSLLDVLPQCDIVFCNEHEAAALFDTRDTKASIAALQQNLALSVLTQSEKGAWLITDETTHHIAAKKTTPIDSTGAGDQFAAGFLAGLIQKKSLQEAGAQGAQCAAHVLSHIGARPK